MQDRDAVGGPDVEPSVRVQHQAEARRVDERVVPTADPHEVLQIGRAAVLPVDDVVRVQLVVARAPGEAAALAVDRPEQVAQRTADDPLRPAEVVRAQVGRRERSQPTGAAAAGQRLQHRPEARRRQQLAVALAGPARQRVDLRAQLGTAAPVNVRVGRLLIGQRVLGQDKQRVTVGCRRRSLDGVRRFRRNRLSTGAVPIDLGSRGVVVVALAGTHLPRCALGIGSRLVQHLHRRTPRTIFSICTPLACWASSAQSMPSST